MQPYRIHLAKETFKFSSTHFTLFSSTDAERLHGHNYHVAVDCELSSLGPMAMGFDFNSLKPIVKETADLWDERVLLPKHSPFVKIQEEALRGKPHVTIDFQDRSYRFPSDDVAILETENITSEELARLFALRLVAGWKKAPNQDPTLKERVRALHVSIEETRGQAATYSITQPLAANRSDVR